MSIPVLFSVKDKGLLHFNKSMREKAGGTLITGANKAGQTSFHFKGVKNIFIQLSDVINSLVGVQNMFTCHLSKHI